MALLIGVVWNFITPPEEQLIDCYGNGDPIAAFLRAGYGALSLAGMGRLT
jgi:hypothetical protein